MRNSETFILTDVLPGELPLIYNNASLYKFVLNCSEWEEIDCDYNSVSIGTQPFKYKIGKNGQSKRLISLVHPISQLVYTKFIEDYEQEILHYFDINGAFSIRHPTAKATQESLKGLTEKQISSLDNKELYKKTNSYFKYQFPNLTQFYKSRILLELEIQYSWLQKIDIQNCFSSIYTHSLEWAYLGSKSLVKKRFRGESSDSASNNVGRLLDRIMQCSNDYETNGIIIGSEFSRIVSEIILSRIDDDIFKKLQEDGYKLNKDYTIIRFIDDIFIFTNKKKLGKKIANLYREELLEYKLRLNESKSFCENKPFLQEHNWIPALKEINDQIKDFLEFNLNKPAKVKGFRRNAIYSTSRATQSLKQIISDFDNEKSSIISYFISSISSIIENTISKLEIENNSLGNKYLTPKEALIIKIEHTLDLFQLALTFSPKTRNVVKYCKTCLNLIEFDKSLENILYKKAYQLLKSKDTIPTELLNILVFLKFLDRDLPEKILLKALNKEDISYLKLIVVAFYLCKDSRRNKYVKTKTIVNNYLKEICSELNQQLSNSNYEATLRSNNLVILKDFLNCPILFHDEKEIIEDLFDDLENWINSKGGSENSFYNVYCEYIISDKPGFVDWKYLKEDMKTDSKTKLKKKREKGYS